MTAPTSDTALLRLTNATKRYGAVTALEAVDLTLEPGEVHVLLGENGAGKSTLVGAVTGKHPLSEGTISVRGTTPERYDPVVARALGVRAVLQEFSLFEELTVTQNIFFGHELTRLGLHDTARMRSAAAERLRVVDAGIHPDDRVGTLTRAEQQLVEIAKAIDDEDEPGVLLLDEPTASISDREARRLFDLIGRLRDKGWAILYISHRMEELRRVGDRVTVLRDGRRTGTHPIGDVDDDALVDEMAGRQVDRSRLTSDVSHGTDRAVLEVDHLATRNGRVRDVSFTVHAGEVVGLGGLVGSGKGDVGGALFGLSAVAAGEVRVDGRPVRPNARAMYAAGLGFVAEDRKRQGLFGQQSVQHNLVVERLANSTELTTAGMVRSGRAAGLAGRLVHRLDVRPRSATRMPVLALSGGNQQKALLGRALSAPRRALVVIEPTAGVDVNARIDIYTHLRQECADGVGVLVVSSDAEELLALCDRVLVMSSGTVTAELTGDDLTAETIVAAAFGHSDDARKERHD